MGTPEQQSNEPRGVQGEGGGDRGTRTFQKPPLRPWRLTAATEADPLQCTPLVPGPSRCQTPPSLPQPFAQ